MNLRRRMVDLGVLLVTGLFASSMAQALQREDTAPDVKVRANRIVFPEPQQSTETGQPLSFSNPAIVVAATMDRDKAVAHIVEALAEQGLADVPVLALTDRIWPYDALFYVEVKYPRSPIGILLGKRGFAEPWDKLGSEGYCIHVEPAKPELKVGHEIFIVGMSQRALVHATQSLRQILTFTQSRRPYQEMLSIPQITILDWPDVAMRGVAMKISEPRELSNIFQRLVLLKMNCFLDLQTAEPLDDVGRVRVRRAVALAREYELEYIAAINGVQGAFSTAELFKRDERLMHMEELIGLGVKRLIIMENEPTPPPLTGLAPGPASNPARQQLAFFKEAQQAANRIDQSVRLDVWPITDFGLPGSKRSPQNWYTRGAREEAASYFQDLRSGLAPRARLLWRGADASPLHKRNRGALSTFAKLQEKRRTLYLDDHVGWQAQLFQPFDPSGLSRSATKCLICNFSSPAASRAVLMPTLYSAADCLWNMRAYRPTEKYFQEILTQLAGPAGSPQLRLLNNWLRPYSAPNAPLDGEQLLRLVSAPEELQRISAALSGALVNAAPQIKDLQLRREVMRALRGFLQQIDAPSLLATLQTGSLDEKMDALHNLSLIGDRAQVNALADLQQEEINIRVILKMAGVLLQLGRSDDPVALIEQSISDPRDEIRWAAIAALAHDPQNRKAAELLSWQGNLGNSPAVRLAAAYALAANDNVEMFKFLLAALTDPELSPAEHQLALSHLQRLTGLKTPVSYINSSEMKTRFSKRYKQLVRARKAERKRASRQQDGRQD